MPPRPPLFRVHLPRRPTPRSPPPPSQRTFLAALAAAILIGALLTAAYLRAPSHAPPPRQAAAAAQRWAAALAAEPSESAGGLPAAQRWAAALAVEPSDSPSSGPPAPPPPPPPAAAHCASPPTHRGALDPRTLSPRLAWAPGQQGRLFAHAAPRDPACPRYVMAYQNEGAGAGHRLRLWDAALWAALTLPGPPALLHTSLDVNPGDHGGYEGMDALLGLTLGEGVLRVEGKGTGSWRDENWLKDRGVKLVQLPRVGELPYPGNEAAVAAWGGAMAAESAHPCVPTVHRLPLDQWPARHGDATRGITAWKFAAAAAARRRANATLQLPGAAAGHWAPGAVHIGVHFRVTDALLVPAAALAEVVRGSVLEALAEALGRGAGGEEEAGGAAATPVHLHIFSESVAPEKEAAELLALQGAPPPPANPRGAALRVFFYGPEVGALDAIWALSQCDFFVGSVSSLSWVVAHFGSRPVSLLQSWDKAGDYAWCVEGSVCCNGGTCNLEGKAGEPLRAAAARIAEMARCGQLNEEGWEMAAEV